MNQLIEELILSDLREDYPDWVQMVQQVKEYFLQKKKNEIHLLILKSLLQILNVITLRDSDSILIYNSTIGIYEEEGEVDLKRLIHSIHPALNRHDTQEIVQKIRNQTYIDRQYLDDPCQITMKNGVYDFDEGTLDIFRPSNPFTTRLDINYDPDAIPTIFYHFLDEILEEEYHDLIQELFGYCLISGYPWSKIFLFRGTGANGKTTFLNLLTTFLGNDNVSNILLQDLDKSFSIIGLYNKRANIFADLPEKPVKYTASLKILTGGDRIRARSLYQNFIEFTNSAKLIFSSNKLPEFKKDDTFALWRRMILVEFSNTFEGKNDDPQILEKLTTPQELSGLFNYALKGKRRLEENNYFSNFKTVGETRKEILQLTNTIHSFVDQCLISDVSDEAREEYDVVWRQYLDFCITIQQPPQNKTTLTKDLPLYIPTAELRRSGNKKYWKGFRFQEDGK